MSRPSESQSEASPARIANAASLNVAFALAQAGLQVILFATLARALSPKDYGVFAFANAIVVYAAHLSQRGLAAALLRKKELDAGDFGASYIMCAIVALGSIAILLSASLAILLLSQGNLSEQCRLLAFMSIPLAAQILSTPANALLQRRLNFGAISSIQFFSILFGNGILSIGLAKAGFGAWSLAYGSAFSTVMTSGLSMWLGQTPVSFNIKSGTIKKLLWEGVQFNILRSLDAAWSQAPSVILSISAPANVVGVYQRMQYLADLALQMTVWRVSSVIYASFAKTGMEVDIRERYRQVYTAVFTLTAPITVFFICSAENIVSALLGDKWLSGVPTLRILSLAFALYTLNQASSMVLEHAGMLKRRIFSALVTLIFLFSLLITFQHGNENLFSVPALASAMISTLTLLYFVGERPADISTLLHSSLPGILLGIAVAIGSFSARSLAGGLPTHVPPLLALVIQCVGSGVCLLLAVIPVARLGAASTFVNAAAKIHPLFGKLRGSVRQ